MIHQPIGLWAVLILLTCCGCSSEYAKPAYSRSADPYCQIRCGIENIYGLMPTLEKASTLLVHS